MSVLNEKHVKYTCINCNFFKKRPLKKILKLNNSENLRYSVNLKKSEIWKILKIWPFLKEFWGLPCREIEQDLNLKIQKVWPEARRNKNKNNNTPTHPMTMPLKRLVKHKTCWDIPTKAKGTIYKFLVKLSTTYSNKFSDQVCNNLKN